MNSFSNMELALESEIRRQIRFYAAHPHESIETGTYRFDPETGQIVLMRLKEEAADYRYFPEPDLPPILLTTAEIEQIRLTLPELPHDRYKRYLSQLSIPQQPAEILISSKKLADYFEEALKICPNSKSLASWITVEFSGRLKARGQNLYDTGISSRHIAELVNLIDQGKITGKIAKAVADEMVLHPDKSPQTIVSENPDFQALHDTSAIEALVDQVLSENPDSITDYKAGKARAFGHLVGQVMKLSRGTASPAVVNELLKMKLG